MSPPNKHHGITEDHTTMINTTSADDDTGGAESRTIHRGGAGD